MMILKKHTDIHKMIHRRLWILDRIMKKISTPEERKEFAEEYERLFPEFKIEIDTKVVSK